MNTQTKNWTALYITQFLGVFNDNLLKNLIIFAGVLWLPTDNNTWLLPTASALLVLPFLIVSPFAGNLAGTQNKTKVVRIAKLAEIPVMLVAIAGFYNESIVICLSSMLLMGLQSALMAPSKFGLIQFFAKGENCAKPIGIIELLTFTAVIAAILVAGISVSSPIVFGSLLFIISIGGALSSRALDNSIKTAQHPTSVNPITYFIKEWKIAKDTKRLQTTLLALAGFWFMAAFLQMTLFVYAPETLKLNTFETSLLWAVVATGIGLGCFVSGLINKRQIQIGSAFLGIAGSFIGSLSLFFFQQTLASATFLFALTAFSMGLFKVPINAWMQQTVKPERIGKVLALNNLMLYTFILLASLAFGGLSPILSPVSLVGVFAGLSFIAAILMILSVPDQLVRYFIKGCAKILFKIKIEGLQNIPTKKGALIVANHPSYLDFLILAATLPRNVRFVMHASIYNLKLLKPLFKKFNMIPIAPRGGKNDLEAFNCRVAKEVNDGHVVIIFPEGMVTRNGQIHSFRKGIEHIGKLIESPVIPVFIGGFCGIPLSYNTQLNAFNSFKLSNWKKKIIISIGKPMHSELKAAVYRNTLIALSAENLIVDKKANLAYRFLKQKNQIIANIDGRDVELNEIRREAILLAFVLQKKLKKYSGVEIKMNNKINELKFFYALVLLGKTAHFSPSKKGCYHTLSDHSHSYNEGDLNTQEILSLIKQHPPVMNSRTLLKTFGNQSDQNTIVATWQGANFDNKFIFEMSKNLTQILPIKKSDRISICYTGENNLWRFINYFGFITSGIILNPRFTHQLSNVIITEGKWLNDNIQYLIKNNTNQLIFTIDKNLTPLNKQLLEDSKKTILSGFGIDDILPVLSVNTPNFEGKDIAGKPLKQTGNHPQSVGRLLPGVAVKIVDPANSSKELNFNETGKICIKSNFSLKTENQKRNEWITTSMLGHIDENGFLFNA